MTKLLLVVALLTTGPSGTTRQGIQRSELWTLSDRTLFVETTGSDAAPCSQANPCLTVQAALSKLPKKIRHQVVVQLGAGNFGGFYLDGFEIESTTAVGAWLKVSGTLGTVTPTTGIGSGAVTSATSTNTPTTTWASLTSTGAGWTANDLRGKLVEIFGVGAGQVRAIAANTTDTITIAGTWSTTPTVGSTFAIRMPTTSITTAIAWPATVTTSSIASYCGVHASNLRIGIGGNSGLVLEQLRFTQSTGRGFCAWNPGAMRVRRNSFEVTSNHAILVAKGTDLGISENVAVVPSSSSFVDANGANAGSLISSTGNVVLGAGNYINSTEGRILSTRNLVVGAGKGTSSFLFHPGNLINGTITGDRYSDCGHAIRGDFSPSNSSEGTLLITGIQVDSCTLVAHAKGHLTIIFDASATSGGSNDQFFHVFEGARVVLEDTAWGMTADEATDVEIEGRGYALSAIRAQTPRMATDVATGAGVYEVDRGVPQIGGPAVIGASFIPAKVAELPTCSATIQGAHVQILGGSGQGRTRFCACDCDGAATPACAWLNYGAGVLGTATSCPAAP